MTVNQKKLTINEMPQSIVDIVGFRNQGLRFWDRAHDCGEARVPCE
jgi:hypothetical protein